MRSPITDLAEGLMWTREGTVWAIWRVVGLPYPFQPMKEKALVRAHHTALYRALRGESLHLGVTASTDPVSVVERMVEGLDLDNRTDWKAECLATLDVLEQIDIGQRAYFIAVPLPNTGKQLLTEPVRAAAISVQDALAIPRRRPDHTERGYQAEQIRTDMPRAFRPRPASVAEMVWLYAHATKRGLAVDGPLPTPDPTTSTRTQRGVLLPPATLDPAGQTDSDKRLGPLQLLKRPYLKVINDDDPDRPSYQTTLAVAGTPSGGVGFPGGEWLGRIEECGQIVDWAVRMTVRSGAEVTRRNRRAVRNLNEQFDQREHEVRAGSSLANAAEALAEYQAIFDSDELEVEVDATTLFTVAAPTPEQTLQAAKELRQYYESMHFVLRADASAQEDLWKATLPGYPTTRVAREYGQLTPAKHFAAGVAMTTTELGDRTGSLLALEIGNGNTRPHPILLNLAGASIRLNVALAMGFVGDLGSGKSVTMKTVAMDAIDRDATTTLLAVDHTEMGEWGIAISLIPGNQSVEISENARYSFDPLRILPPDVAPRITKMFLSVLLGIKRQSPQNLLLSKALRPDYITEHQITSTPALLEHLATTCTLPGARDLADEIRIYSELDLGRAFFDPTLEPMNPNARALAILVSKLQLPTAEDLAQPHLYAELPAEKVFGRAVFALIAAFARHRCFTNRERLDIFANDEFAKTTSSPEAANETLLFVRDGRKHRACLLAGSHDPEQDFAGEVMRGLIAFRVVMRQRDVNLARRAVRWLQGLAPGEAVNEDLVTILSEQTSPVIDEDEGTPEHRRGEAFIRDFRGRIGRGKIMAPLVQERAETVKTTPTNSAGKDLTACAA